MHWGLHGSTLNFQLMIKMHNYSGVLVSFNYLLFVFGNIAFTNHKFYRIKLKGMYKRLIKQATYYAFGMFKNQEPPFPLNEKRKFNPLQKYAYFFVMYLFLPVIILSGIALLYPEVIIEDVYNVNGVFLTAIVHATLGFLVSVFLVVHIYAASIGKSPLKNYKSMVTGWHEDNH
jgi:thiosulfate reductase cytochrome b subunit